MVAVGVKDGSFANKETHVCDVFAIKLLTHQKPRISKNKRV